jgi:hypothetical protein
MGCGNSKDVTADLAGNFFGDDLSVKKPDPVPVTIPLPKAPIKSALAKKSQSPRPEVDSFTKQPITSSPTLVSRSSDGSGGRKKTGRPKTSSHHEGRRNTPPAAEAAVPEAHVRRPASSSSNPNEVAVQSTHRATASHKHKHKNDYVAPPSSESFVTNPSSRSPSPEPNHVRSKAHTKTTGLSPPPPPSKHSSSSVSAKPGNIDGRPQESKEIGDDDFSVAPSLATCYRSVIKFSFDQIYERGQKVRTTQDCCFFCVSRVLTHGLICS